MSVSVTKTRYRWQTGDIPFSQLRSNFYEKTTGEVKVSELYRNTSVSEANPIIPDSTENTHIPTSGQFEISKFKTYTVKRYIAEQTGTDSNELDSGRPGFRMGKINSSGQGIDWSGGGVNGADGTGSSTVGNSGRNVQKIIEIEGTCGGYHSNGQPAAEFGESYDLHNVTLNVSGYIYGHRGLGGTVQDGSAGDGGDALHLGNTGNNCIVDIKTGGRIWAGGGGGEKGYKADDGSDGKCKDTVERSNCGGCPGCPGGYSSGGCRRGSACNRKQVCNWWGNCWREDSEWNHYETCTKEYDVNGGDGGDGGNGGDGDGFSFSATNGSEGIDGTSRQSCFSGGSYSSTPTDGKKGGDGGDGGSWGNDGGGTTAPGSPGKAGKAIVRTAGTKNFSVSGNNSTTVKGKIY